MGDRLISPFVLRACSMHCVCNMLESQPIMTQILTQTTKGTKFSPEFLTPLCDVHSRKGKLFAVLALGLGILD